MHYDSTTSLSCCVHPQHYRVIVVWPALVVAIYVCGVRRIGVYKHVHACVHLPACMCASASMNIVIID
jgi:hypothetical protein